MKNFIRRVLVYAFALFFLSEAIDGVAISGGLQTYIFGGVVFALLYMFLKPVLHIVALPFNLITMGWFSFIINALLLYLLTVLVPDISITSFVFSGFTFVGFVIPKISLVGIFAFVVSSIVLSGLVGFLYWLMDKS